MSKWKPIVDGLKGKYLVTNNIDARDNYGNMSHVWLGHILKEAYGGYFLVTEYGVKVKYLTHYCEIPQPDLGGEA